MESTSSPSTKAEPASIKDLHESIDKEIQHYSKTLLLPEVEHEFFLSVRFMANAGFWDGVNGIKGSRDNEMKAIAKSRASRLFKLAEAFLKGKARAAETNVQAKLELLNRSKERADYQHKNLRIQQYYQQHHPRNVIWSLLCILIALILILADLPLSQKLLEKGFDFKTRIDSLLTAVGVSLCTVFIKIYYDYYIDVKFGNNSIMKAEYSQLYRSIFHENGSVISDKELRGNRRGELFRKLSHLLILILTIAGIVTFGFFRVEAANINSNGSGFSSITYLLTYILLTLIFPIISGVCFSIGFNGVQSYTRFLSTTRKYKRAEKKYVKDLKEYTTGQKEHADIVSLMAKWDENKEGNIYSDILLSYYDFGYKIGLVNPEAVNSGKDLYEIAEKWRAKALARKTNNQITNIGTI